MPSNWTRSFNRYVSFIFEREWTAQTLAVLLTVSWEGGQNFPTLSHRRFGVPSQGYSSLWCSLPWESQPWCAVSGGPNQAINANKLGLESRLRVNVIANGSKP